MNKFIIIVLLFQFVGVLFMSCQGRRSAIAPVDLRCDYLVNPLGIDNPAPPLSWKVVSNERGQAQTAYQIRVARDLASLQKGNADLWDSGKVASDRTVFISYAGKPLASGRRVFWHVRVWDRDGTPSAWSKPAHWEMALLNKADWQARWIGTGEDDDPDSFVTGPAPFFRKPFTPGKKIKSARAYVSGLGYYEFSLNGHKVGDAALVPAQTNYDRRSLKNLLYDYDDQSTTRVLYNIFDVSDMLQPGVNVAGVILGNGWYNQRNRRAEGWMWYDTPRFILQINIEYEDGGRETIVSDASWKTATGPLLHDGIFTGNIYDARLEMRGWNRPGFDAGAWRQARLVRAPTGTLHPQLAPQDKVVRSIKPTSLEKKGDGQYEFDAGEMISGWARIKVRGSRGDTITLRFIEELGVGYGQKDVYIFKGEGVEVFEPRFTWHAFRHVLVSGLKKKPSLDDLDIRVVHTAVAPAGDFQCSNELFNKIYENYIRTQLGNFHSSFSSDCPHRERLGYTGDGQLLVESSIFNFDMTQFYRKWINDMDDARNKRTGFVPHTAPYGGGGGGPAWGASYVIVPWFYYLYYGDASVLRAHYQGMKQWVAYLGTRTDENGIVVREELNGWCLGDWATPARIELPEPLVNTSFYFYCADIMSNVAAVLQNDADKSHFDSLKVVIRSALNQKYLDKSENRYWTSYQGADVFPLAYGMVPEERRQQVFQSLVRHVEKNKGHLDTGILATPLLLEVLTEMGRQDLAFTIMNQWDFPSFGRYILGKGATTLWEEWSGRNSHSHPMYGSVIRWFYKTLAGINPDPKQPGFKHIILKPTPCGDLTFVKAAYNSLHGPIKSDWRIEKNRFRFDCEIPANTTATVFVPASAADNVSVKNSQNVEFVGFENNRAVYNIGSGRYTFFSKQIDEIIKPVHLPTPLILGGETLYHKPDKAVITLTASPGAEVYYTTDGGEPTQNSTKYSAPIELRENTILKIRAFQKGFLPSSLTEQKIHFVDPDVNGLKYTVYEGEWQERPDLNDIRPVATGRTFAFDVNKIQRRDDWVAILFEGVFEIQQGEYTFYASANDGSVVYIDGKIVVDNAGYTGARVTQGKTYLAAGRHSLRVFYYENAGTESLDFEIEGPGTERQPFPPEWVFYPE